MSGIHLHNLLETAIYAKALDSLARSLWIIFAGWLLLVPAVVMFLVLGWGDRKNWDFAGEAQLKILSPILSIVGALLNLYGKYSCFELRQPLENERPLPGARSLSIAFYADVAGALVRLIGRGAWLKFRLMAFPLHIVGQIMFLLFLRKMADVVGRHGLRRLIDFTLATMILSLVCFAAAFLSIPAKVNPFVFLGISVIGLIFLICTTVAYLVGLAQLALALGRFANYLRESFFDENRDPAEESELEAEGT